MKTREILNSDITTLILRWRYGSVVLLVGWLGVHIMLAYEIFTGQMRLPWRFEWIEGRESAPFLYWAYIAGFAAVLLLIDGYFLSSEFRRIRKGKPIQSPQPTAASRRG